VSPRLLFAAALIVLAGASSALSAPTLPWNLVAVRPHDPGAFTQGLVAHGRVLLESTGDCCTPGVGESSVRRVDPRTGKVLAILRQQEPTFGEGLTVLGSDAWQLTWKNGVAYRLSALDLRPLATVPYAREGWGLTRDGRRLVASDGTATLRWLATPDLRVTRSVVVRDKGRPIARLNELEMLNGRVWANIWMDDRIAIIAPGDGRVRGWLDLGRLRSRLRGGGEALNGIARDPVTGHVIVTGKNWDRMFVIRPTAPIP
jgi:glutaminyl-peptide cyclotransferase